MLEGVSVGAAAPREVLAALVAVTARRTHSETVAVTGEVTVELDLSADPTFAELSAEAATLAGPEYTVGGIRLVISDGRASLHGALVPYLIGLSACGISIAEVSPSSPGSGQPSARAT